MHLTIVCQEQVIPSVRGKNGLSLGEAVRHLGHNVQGQIPADAFASQHQECRTHNALKRLVRHVQVVVRGPSDPWNDAHVCGLQDGLPNLHLAHTERQLLLEELHRIRRGQLPRSRCCRRWQK